MTSNTEELKPCPFCGGDKVSTFEHDDFNNANNGKPAWNVNCRYTDCHGSIYSLMCWQFETEEEAIKAWNTRPKQAEREAVKDKRIEELEGQLPEGMEHCTIIFKECEVGHGRLTAKNWVDTGCVMCRVKQAKQALDKEES